MATLADPLGLFCGANSETKNFPRPKAIANVSCHHYPHETSSHEQNPTRPTSEFSTAVATNRSHSSVCFARFFVYVRWGAPQLDPWNEVILSRFRNDPDAVTAATRTAQLFAAAKGYMLSVMRKKLPRDLIG
jgi:hypothetical protein